jgi:hypothetical protein
MWRCAGKSFGKMSRLSANRSRSQGIGARLKYRARPRVAHHLDHIGAEEIFSRDQRMRRSGDRRLRITLQGRGHGFDQRGLEQRLIALDIDHDVGVVPMQARGHFCDPVGTAGMIPARQDGIETVSACRGYNPFVIGGHPDTVTTRASGRRCHTHDHRLPGDVGQGLSRQPRRGIARRDDDADRHQDSSVDPSCRASSSSITGMSSLTGYASLQALQTSSRRPCYSQAGPCRQGRRVFQAGGRPLSFSRTNAARSGLTSAVTGKTQTGSDKESRANFTASFSVVRIAPPENCRSSARKSW